WWNKRSSCGIIRFQRVGHPLRRKQNGCSKPNCAYGEIEATRYLGKRSDFCIVDPAEAVRLHHPVPHAPDKRHKHDSFQIPHGKSSADNDQKDRRTNETPSEALKKRAIAVGSNHPRQMMSHCAERCYEEIDILRAPDALCADEYRHQ